MKPRVRWMVRALTLAMVVGGSCGIRAASDEPESVRIDIRDLDLTTARDVERLYARIRRAARRVCDWRVSVLYLQMSRAGEEGCYGATVSETVARLNLAPLIEVHERAGGR